MNLFRRLTLPAPGRRRLTTASLPPTLFSSISPGGRLPGGVRAPLAAPTLPRCMPLKPGEPIQALKIFKNEEAPIVKPRHEYPEWVNTLAEKDVSLAQLRRMEVEDATDREQRRFLKLTRRIEIRSKNEASKAK